MVWLVCAAITICCVTPALSDTPASDFIDEHNAWRAEVGSAALTWDTDIAAIAQEWAEWLRDNNDCSLQHRSRSDLNSEYSGGALGENLYWAWTSTSSLDKTPIDAVASWAEEREDYAYGPTGDSCTTKNGASNPVGHYTQVTWHESQKVGCGSATCSPSGGGTSGVWVCNYFPAGNVASRYPFCEANVPSGMSKCSSIETAGQPECGTPCGSCAALSPCCSCSIDSSCLVDSDVPTTSAAALAVPAWSFAPWHAAGLALALGCW